MYIDIHSHGLELNEKLRDYARQQITSRLGRSAAHVARIAVELSNNPESDRRKHSSCRIQVRLEPSLEVLVEDAETDLLGAIDRASERVGRAVTRSLGRWRRARLASRMTREMGAKRFACVDHAGVSAAA